MPRRFYAHPKLGSGWAAACLSSLALGCGLFGYERVPASSDPALGAHCSNTVQDADETGPDCGGPSCAACDPGLCVGDDCTNLTCGGLPCPPVSCADGVQNQDETGIDCGGSSCVACPAPPCTGNNCPDPTCVGMSCLAATCFDGVQNQDEAAVDCGGASCSPCATCADGLQNQDETAIDCGGATCPACLSCSDGLQNQDETAVDCGGATCAACPTCYDGVQNQDETAVDCGGSDCFPCPTCSDGARNQDETAVDCGGTSCPACSACADGIQNQDETAVDCGGATCPACPTCSDGVQNQDETGLDCGGSSCPACPSCSDGIQNQDETGLDCGGTSCVACGINTPPIVRFTVTPGLGSHDGAPATTFQGDAGATTDREDAGNALTYSWDWNDDGVTDATGVTSSHVYGAAGTFSVRVTAQDTGGLSSQSTFLVIVSSETSIVRVTTATDENTVGATPASPGDTGLSLAEAINYANLSAGRQSILVPAGFAIALGDELPTPTDALGLDIIGDGALLDGSGAGNADDCIRLNSPNNRIFGLEIQNCPRSPLRLLFSAANSQFSRLNVHDNPLPVILNGANVHFGPNNEVSRSAAYCLSVIGQDAIIDRNFLHDCAGRGIDLTGSCDGVFVLGNLVTRCYMGALIGNGAVNLTLLHNVLHANESDGLLASTTVSGVVLQNNIFSNNVQFGVRGSDGVFVSNDHNDYFGNAIGTCSQCSLGTGSLTADPSFMDSSTDDLRLQPGSPLINAGVDTGNDVNGTSPGLFNGSSPDIGAHESN